MASERNSTSTDVIPRLTTITLGYSIEQDRVRLEGADADGKTFTFWLTARLLNRLVPHLIERLTDMQLSAQNPSSTTMDEADSSGEQANNVKCVPGSPEILVASIDVSTREGQLLLVFKDSEEVQRGIFAMTQAALPRWNGGLKQCFEQAEWSQSVFQSRSPSEPVRQGAITIH